MPKTKVKAPEVREPEPRVLLVNLTSKRPSTPARIFLSTCSLRPHTHKTPDEIKRIKGTVCVNYGEESWIGSPIEATVRALKAFYREWIKD